MEKNNQTLIIAGAVLIVLVLVLNKLFGKDEGEKEGDTIEKKGVLDYNKYIETIKKAPKGREIFSMGFVEQGAIANELSKLLFIKGVPDYLVDVPEEKVIAQIKRAGTKPDMVVIAKSYATRTKRDLYSDLKVALNDEEQKIAFGYINGLPDYVKAKPKAKK